MKLMNTELYILQYSDYLIGQILEYNTVVTKAEFLFMIQSVNLPPSAHTITSSAHCSTLQPSAACSQPSSAHPVHTAAAITSSVHTAAMYSYLQPTFSAHCSQLQPSTTIYTAAILSSVLSSAHCSYTIQCTLQIYYPVYTAAILSSAHCSYTIQFTLQFYHPVHTAVLPSSAHCSSTIQYTLQLHYLVLILYRASSAPLDHHRLSLYHYWPTSRADSRH